MINFKKLLETTNKPIGQGAQDFAKKAAQYGKKLDPFIGSDEVMQAFKGRPPTKNGTFKAKVDHGTKKDKTKIASYENGEDKEVYEEVELSEETEMMPGNIALALVDRHTSAAMYHKKNGNMKGYAAHIIHATAIEDKVIQAGSNMPIRSKAIVDKSDKIWAAHPHKTSKNESVEDFNPVLSAVLKEDVASFTEFVESILTTRTLEEVRIKTNRADKKAVIVHEVDPETGQSKTFTRKAATGEIAISETFKRGDMLHIHGGVSTKHPAVHLGSRAVYLDADGSVEEVPERAMKTAEKMKKVTSDHKAQAAEYLKHIPEDKDPCWDGYKQLGIKKKNGKDVPNCVKEETELSETFKPGSMSLQDKSSINISKEDAMTLNTLYGTLSDNNKAKMDSKLRKNKNGYSEILAFAQSTV